MLCGDWGLGINYKINNKYLNNCLKKYILNQ